MIYDPRRHPKPRGGSNSPGASPCRPNRRPIDAKARYAKRKQTIEPVFGIIKSTMGFRRFHLRGLRNVASE